MRAFKEDRPIVVFACAIASYRRIRAIVDRKTDRGREEINGDDSGVFHTAFALVLSANFAAVISRLVIRERPRRMSSCDAAISKAAGQFSCSRISPRFIRTLQSTCLSLMGRECVDLPAGTNLPDSTLADDSSRFCVKRHSICLPSSPLLPPREINAIHKV